jgi:nitroreductase
MNNSIFKAIKNRKSIFPASYTQQEIKQEDLYSILDSARWAPTHKKTEPWRYKVIRGTALEELGVFMESQFQESTGKASTIKIRKLAEKMSQASVVILIFMHRDEKESIPEWEEIAAVSMSVQNMWIAASELGYGAYWSSPKSFADLSKFDRIHCDANDRFLGFLYLGTMEAGTVVDHRVRKGVNDFTEFVD